MLSISSTFPARVLKAASAAQMREFDRRSIEEYGIPGIVLMENAGRHVAEAAVEFLLTPECRAAVVCGRGNNGGDGFVAARHLRDRGYPVLVYLLADPESITGDARTNLDILLKTGTKVQKVDSASDLRTGLLHSSLIIDAVLGTGLHGEVKDLAADVIQAINDSGRPVLAVDVPSGLDADTGRAWGEVVDADLTVTFALPKTGLLMYPGAAHAGELLVVDIGIPQALFEDLDVGIPTGDWVTGRLPDRPEDGHKGTFGTVLTVAGSAGFTGAAALASEAALRAGAGLSVLAVPESLQDLMATKLTEVMCRALPETETRAASTRALDRTVELSSNADCLVIGCGIGTHPSTRELVRKLAGLSGAPMVADADALNCLAQDFPKVHREMIITPHPGEMTRLLGTTTQQVQSDRIGAAREAASRFGCTVVLKGAGTLIAEPGGRLFINPTGGPVLAAGGSGDVLAGMIGALVAQGLKPFEAAAVGVYIHGLAGERASESRGSAGVLAREISDAIPGVLADLRSG